MVAADLTVMEYHTALGLTKSPIALLQIPEQIKVLHQFVQFRIRTPARVAKTLAAALFGVGV